MYDIKEVNKALVSLVDKGLVTMRIVDGEAVISITEKGKEVHRCQTMNQNLRKESVN
jgi:predicted transcriptional regulator